MEKQNQNAEDTRNPNGNKRPFERLESRRIEGYHFYVYCVANDKECQENADDDIRNDRVDDPIDDRIGPEESEYPAFEKKRRDDPDTIGDQCKTQDSSRLV